MVNQVLTWLNIQQLLHKGQVFMAERQNECPAEFEENKNSSQQDLREGVNNDFHSLEKEQDDSTLNATKEEADAGKEIIGLKDFLDSLGKSLAGTLSDGFSAHNEKISECKKEVLDCIADLCSQSEKQSSLISKNSDLVCSEISKLGDSLSRTISCIKKDFEHSLSKCVSDSAKEVLQKVDNLHSLSEKQCESILSGVTAVISKNTEEVARLHNSLSRDISGGRKELETSLSQVNSQLSTIANKLLEENQQLQGKISALGREHGRLESDNKGLKEKLSVSINELDQQKNQLDDVRQKFLNENKRADRLESQIQVKTSELSTRVEQCNALEEKVRSLAGDLNAKCVEIERLNKDIASSSSKLEITEKKYQRLKIDDNILMAFDEYCSLQDKTKGSLAAIFPHQTFLGFVSAGLRLNNISSLWEMTKRNIFNDNLEDAEKLNIIFEVLMTVYDEGSSEKQFELIRPAIGSVYDSSTSAIKEVKSSGTVRVVHLTGYKNLRDGSIHKAVISVND